LASRRHRYLAVETPAIISALVELVDLVVVIVDARLAGRANGAVGGMPSASRVGESRFRTTASGSMVGGSIIGVRAR
jgi:hypothetical protein